MVTATLGSNEDFYFKNAHFPFVKAESGHRKDRVSRLGQEHGGRPSGECITRRTGDRWQCVYTGAGVAPVPSPVPAPRARVLHCISRIIVEQAVLVRDSVHLAPS